MPVSRRGFFDIIAAGRTDQLSDAFRAARGNGEYVADLQQQPATRPQKALTVFGEVLGKKAAAAAA